MSYRKDIQILRGVAVLLVLFFHLEIDVFRNGYLGVDIFFVISGFLMSALYQPGQARRFFEKRARRLFPAYFFTVLAVLVSSFFIAVPTDFREVDSQAMFGLFLASNVGYWLENSYFADGLFQPLLHLWSLGVEIQYYLVVPMVCWLARKSRVGFLALVVAGMVGCLSMVEISPKTSFFLTPLRAWQFLIGAAAAEFFTERGNVPETQWLRWLRWPALLTLIVIPFLPVEPTALDFVRGHPGLYAALLCSVVGVTLVCGVPSVITASPVGTAFEVVGKYSYSIYLVHYPLIVLYYYAPFSGTTVGTMSLASLSVLLGLTTVLSVLVYHLIENPLRHRGLPGPHQALVVALPVLVAIVAAAGPIVKRQMHSAEENFVFDAWHDRDSYRCGTWFRITSPQAQSCGLVELEDTPRARILLVGNSHADSIKATFAAVARSKNTAVRFMVRNDPLMPLGSRPEEIVREAVSHDIDTLVLHYSLGAIEPAVVAELVTHADQHSLPVKFMMPIPNWKTHVPKALWQNLCCDEPLPTQTLQEYANVHASFLEGLSSIDSRNFSVYSVAEVFCDEQCRLTDEGGSALYFDEHHLTLTGSQRLTPVFAAVIEDSIDVGPATATARPVHSGVDPRTRNGPKSVRLIAEDPEELLTGQTLEPLVDIGPPRRISPDAVVTFVSQPWKVDLSGDVRNALVQLPWLPLRKEVLIGSQTTLRFGIGVWSAIPGGDESTQRLTYRVSLQSESLPVVTLFEETLAPSPNATSTWLDTAVDLSDYAGQRVVLSFTVQTRDVLDLWRGLPLWANPEVVVEPTPRGIDSDGPARGAPL